MPALEGGAGLGGSEVLSERHEALLSGVRQAGAFGLGGGSERSVTSAQRAMQQSIKACRIL